MHIYKNVLYFAKSKIWTLIKLYPKSKGHPQLYGCHEHILIINWINPLKQKKKQKTHRNYSICGDPRMGSRKDREMIFDRNDQGSEALECSGFGILIILGVCQKTI